MKPWGQNTVPSKKKELAHVITNMLNILNVNKYVNIYVHKYLFYIILKQLRLYYAYQKKYCESVSSGSLWVRNFLLSIDTFYSFSPVSQEKPPKHMFYFQGIIYWPYERCLCTSVKHHALPAAAETYSNLSIFFCKALAWHLAKPL
jgi:hypothetical protein